MIVWSARGPVGTQKKRAAEHPQRIIDLAGVAFHSARTHLLASLGIAESARHKYRIAQQHPSDEGAAHLPAPAGLFAKMGPADEFAETEAILTAF